MVTFNPGRHSQIKSCETLCIDPVSIMLSTKGVKNAWNVICKLGNICKPYELVGMILMVLSLVLDCNGFLEGSGVCLDQQGSLNWAAILISVSHFF